MLLYIEAIKLMISIAILVIASSKLVDSATKFASALGLSGTVIGLTLIGYGTSLPELFVSSIASIKGYSAVSIGDIVGSNIFNIGIVMGIAAAAAPLAIKRWEILRKNSIIMLASVLILSIILSTGSISREIGCLMIISFIAYTIYTIKYDKENSDVKKDYKISKTNEFLTIVTCLFFVLVSSRILIESTVNIAHMMSISEWIISTTIIAAGTGMPEAAISIIAARKGQFGISIGNIVGTNIFNIMSVLGIASVLNPLSIDFLSIRTDLIFLSVISLLFMIGIWKKNITRYEGFAYVSIYVLYIVYIISMVL